MYEFDIPERALAKHMAFLDSDPANPEYRYALECARTHPHLWENVYNPTAIELATTYLGGLYTVGFLHTYAVMNASFPNTIISPNDTYLYDTTLRRYSAYDIQDEYKAISYDNAYELSETYIQYGYFPTGAQAWLDARMKGSKRFMYFCDDLASFTLTDESGAHIETPKQSTYLSRGIIDAAYLFHKLNQIGHRN